MESASNETNTIRAQYLDYIKGQNHRMYLQTDERGSQYTISAFSGRQYSTVGLNGFVKTPRQSGQILCAHHPLGTAPLILTGERNIWFFNCIPGTQQLNRFHENATHGLIYFRQKYFDMISEKLIAALVYQELTEESSPYTEIKAFLKADLNVEHITEVTFARDLFGREDFSFDSQFVEPELSLYPSHQAEAGFTIHIPSEA